MKIQWIAALITAAFLPMTANSGPVKPAKAKKSLILTFAGDIMANPMITGALSRDRAALEPIRPFLTGDLNFANLEFTVNTNLPSQGYPQFNGTREYLRYFKNYFNIFSVANNHVYDHGARSEADTLEFLKEDGVLALGGNTEAPHTPPLITNINGVDLLFTAYSMVDNGLYVRSTNSSARYYMNFYPNPTDAAAKVKEDLAGVPPRTLKIVSLHFGEEYCPRPNASDTVMPKLLIEAGADIVVGHHPHVPRPALWYEGTNHSGVILYSLGNFYTPHKNSYLYLDAGVIVTLEVLPDKSYTFRYMPTFTYFFDGPDGVRSRVLPLEHDPAQYPPAGYTYTARDKKNMNDAYAIIHEFYGPLLGIRSGEGFSPK